MNDIPSNMFFEDNLFIAAVSQISSTDWENTLVEVEVSGGGILGNQSLGISEAPLHYKTIKVTRDVNRNIYLAGSVFSPSTGYDILVVKLDENMNQLWNVDYNSSGVYNDIPKDIAVDLSGNVIVTGYSETGSHGTVYKTLKYNSSGILQWEREYNGKGNGNDTAMALALDNGNNIYAKGASFNGINLDYVTIKYNTDGDLLWDISYNGLANGNDVPAGISIDMANNIYISGQSETDAGVGYLTIKYSQKQVIPANDTTKISGA